MCNFSILNNDLLPRNLVKYIDNFTIKNGRYLPGQIYVIVVILCDRFNCKTGGIMDEK